MAARQRQKIERVLVIHTAFLGDIILTTPFLAGLRQVFPRAEILFVTTQGGAALLSPNPWGVKTTVFDKKGSDAGLGGLRRKIRELKKFAPDVTFCLHRSLRSVLLARGVGAESWGFRDAACSFLLRGRVRREQEYEAEKNLAVLDRFLATRNIETLFSPFPHLEWTPDETKKAEDLTKRMHPYIVLAPGSVWPTKRWPAERFGEVALHFAKLGIQSVVVGGGTEKDIAAKVCSAYLARCSPSERGLVPLDLSGKTTLGVLKAVLAKAKLVIANDSSPLHIAIAVGVPVHGVFGPTTKNLGFFPLAPVGKSGVSEVEGLDCRPCGKHGHQICPKQHFRCMLDLHSATVFEEARKICR